MSEKYAESNGLKICYEEFGSRDNPTILLIMGLGTQMIAWPLPFCEHLANGGFHVVRFDNRDVGRSTRMEGTKVPNLIGLMLRARVGASLKVPYHLEDMMRDATGLLDALAIERAHIVGVSMGGMIGQLLAAHHPERCHTFTSIMSTSGAAHLPGISGDIQRQMFRKAPADLDAYVDNAIKTWRLIGSAQYPPPEDELRTRIRNAYHRAYYPAGYRRQMAAVIANGSREELLKTIEVPALVIHGKADKLVPVEGGMHTASLIPGAELELIDGMGHDLPGPLLPRIADRILARASRP